MQKQWNTLKISLPSKKKYKHYEQVTREFLELRMRNFQDIIVIRTPANSTIFKSALSVP